MLGLLPCELADGRVVANSLTKALALDAKLEVMEALRVLDEACEARLLEILKVLEVAEEGRGAQDGLLCEGCGGRGDGGRISACVRFERNDRRRSWRGDSL